MSKHEWSISEKHTALEDTRVIKEMVTDAMTAVGDYDADAFLHHIARISQYVTAILESEESATETAFAGLSEIETDDCPHCTGYHDRIECHSDDQPIIRSCGCPEDYHMADCPIKTAVASGHYFDQDDFYDESESMSGYDD